MEAGEEHHQSEAWGVVEEERLQTMLGEEAEAEGADRQFQEEEELDERMLEEEGVEEERPSLESWVVMEVA